MIIHLIIHAYFSYLLIIMISSIFIFFSGAYLLFKKNNSLVATPNVEDISAIAGDEIVDTQLDLARAYIESGMSELAKPILLDILKNGQGVSKQAARQLLESTLCA